MIPFDYVWLFWSSAFLVPWIALYLLFPLHRREMIWASAFTTPFGLTEPLFVPEYWNPPSLFDLASRTGFDIESLIFCFAIGGVGAVLVDVLLGSRLEPVPFEERRSARHRFHLLAIAAPFASFPLLYLAPWNPIYPGIVSMLIGAAATMTCRPDLKWQMLLGGAVFLAYYILFLAGLELTSPDYIERVWNLDAISGIKIAGMPVEELLFALTFGMYWSTVYEHFKWRIPRRRT